MPSALFAATSIELLRTNLVEAMIIHVACCTILNRGHRANSILRLQSEGRSSLRSKV